MGKIKLYHEPLARQIARVLLTTKAVTLSPDEPYTWASGWRSPIYCDNRKVLSHPSERRFIRESLRLLFQKEYILQKQVKAIAGVAQGGVPLGAILAEDMERPFYFIRSAKKDHGKGNQVEGDSGLLSEKTPILIIEDLISTGGSSFRAAMAMQEFAPIHAMIAIFTYGFPQSEETFAEVNFEVVTLCNYQVLVEEAKEMNYLNKDKMELLQSWSADPANWSPAT